MRVAVLCDEFPSVSETFVANEVAALRRLGHDVRVLAHAGAADPLGRRSLPAALRLAGRFPQACVRDEADRGGWRPAEQPPALPALAPAALDLRAWGAEHLHVHFAAGAATTGLRVGAILGLPVSITAHAYDIFQTPLNLARKLRRAAFATSGCDYNVRHLRGVEPGARVHRIVMGVDAERFRRSGPGGWGQIGGHVVTVGRLVPKKGFATLIEAVERAEAVERLTIVGEGPLDAELRAQAGAKVAFAGAQTPERIRGLLEEAAVFALPSVIAPDGDRDSMPVVLKEAMAMEVPVVSTDAVGIPELVDDAVGRLVAPGDVAALAGALDELLRFAPEQRAALGAAGRARVRERADVDTETAKLAALIEEVAR